MKKWILRVWCSFFFIFFIWFARFQILICEPQSIFRKLLVLSWLYKKQHYYIKIQSKLLPEKSGRCGSWKRSDNFEKTFWYSQIFTKTNKQIRFSSKNEFVCSFFGRIRGYQKDLSKLSDLYQPCLTADGQKNV